MLFRSQVEELWVRVGTAAIQEIVSNNPLTFGADQVRVVRGFHTFDIPADLAAAYAEARGDQLQRERRFEALLVYDHYAKKWAFGTSDVGDRQG